MEIKKIARRMLVLAMIMVLCMATCFTAYGAEALTVTEDVVSYTINPTHAGYTLASAPAKNQDASNTLLVKNNIAGYKGGNTRRAYVKFDLNNLKDYMAEYGLEIDSAEVSYSAKIDRNINGSKTVHVKEVQETGWNSADLVWNNAPVFGADIAYATVSGTEYENKTADITAYVTKRIADGSSTATLGFGVNKCAGESIVISNTTSDMPTITVTLKGSQRVLVELEITTPPTDTEYVEGQTFNPAGMVVTAIYNDGTTEVVTDYEVTSEPLTVSDTRVEVSYNGMIDYQTVSVEALEQYVVSYTINPTQAGYTLASAPAKNQDASNTLLVKNNIAGYKGGNTRRAYVKFDLNSLKDYMAENGLEIDSAELTYSAKIDRNINGSKTVHVKEVQETGWNSADLVWNNAPVFGTNIAYATVSGTEYENKTADITAYVTKRIADGSSTATLGFGVNKCAGELIVISNTTSDMPTITVTLKGSQRTLVELEITTPPTDTEYVEGEIFDPAGMVVEAVYNYGDNEVVTDYQVTSRSLTVSDTSVEISYQGKTAYQSISVKEWEPNIRFEDNCLCFNANVRDGEYLKDYIVYFYVGEYADGKAFNLAESVEYKPENDPQRTGLVKIVLEDMWAVPAGNFEISQALVKSMESDKNTLIDSKVEDISIKFNFTTKIATGSLKMIDNEVKLIVSPNKHEEFSDNCAFGIARLYEGKDVDVDGDGWYYTLFENVIAYDRDMHITSIRPNSNAINKDGDIIISLSKAESDWLLGGKAMTTNKTYADVTDTTLEMLNDAYLFVRVEEVENSKAANIIYASAQVRERIWG